MSIYLSIDPGLNNTGIAVVDISSGFKIIETVNVKNARKFTDAEKIIDVKYGSRAVKVMSIIERIDSLLQQYKPTCLVSEAPFYSALTPAAYGSLVEIVVSIKYNVAMKHDIDFFTVEPLLVKKYFTNKGMAAKELMKQFLKLRQADGTIHITTDVDTMTEHEIDAVAVGFSHYVNLQTKLQGEQS